MPELIQGSLPVGVCDMRWLTSVFHNDRANSKRHPTCSSEHSEHGAASGRREELVDHCLVTMWQRLSSKIYESMLLSLAASPSCGPG